MSLDIKALELALEMLEKQQSAISDIQKVIQIYKMDTSKINIRLDRIERILNELMHDTRAEQCLVDYQTMVADQWKIDGKNSELSHYTPETERDFG